MAEPVQPVLTLIGVAFFWLVHIFGSSLPLLLEK